MNRQILRGLHACVKTSRWHEPVGTLIATNGSWDLEGPVQAPPGQGISSPAAYLFGTAGVKRRSADPFTIVGADTASGACGILQSAKSMMTRVPQPQTVSSLRKIDFRVCMSVAHQV